jgi:antitoxin component YwqK of YwqJK toxin-antitoxin module
MKSKQSDNKSPKTGLSKEYFRNGQLCSVGHYADGKKTGVWKYYLLNGKLKATGKYSKGEFTGVWKWYRENGTSCRWVSSRTANKKDYGKDITPMESYTMWVSTWTGKRQVCGRRTMPKEI